VTIPWAKLSSNPSAWIREECFPAGFQWADPSKIRVGQVFQLLDHWRQREKDGLTSLTWNSSCELLTDVERLSQQVRNSRRKDGSESESDSDERDVRHRFSDGEAEDEDFAAQLNEISSEHSDLPDRDASASGRAHNCKYYHFFHMLAIL
jgi:hypothetical protein